VVEAVFEDRELKARVTREAEGRAERGRGDLRLEHLDAADHGPCRARVQRAANFIGIHFFSPVDRMPLVEIVRGKNTSEAVLARVFDFVLQIGKTPIVVNDGRGFFTSRVIGKFLNEAVAMVGEGIEPTSIEQAGLQAGYPAGPLQLLDELTLTLTQKIRDESKKARRREGKPWDAHPSEWVVDKMIDELGRKGRSTGGGFYEYDAQGRRVGVWSGVRGAFNRGRASCRSWICRSGCCSPRRSTRCGASMTEC
jgi:3-hydroxyacyl-CoA dehydrogenase/enoyl-CoA hydratase/3-hydroxybutyryl-CoA epimerase